MYVGMRVNRAAVSQSATRVTNQQTRVDAVVINAHRLTGPNMC